ncbi:hypothetical protein GCM10022286_05680 [Gryllotalpicola daejeonensis]|uniref:Uncharacterized protein n=1 Tax=Gryllotalpicola daejeonensis TaxID=993087 RepID=A0ABP7ZFL3_9MICO
MDTFTPAPAAGYIAEIEDGTRRPVIGWIWDGYQARPLTDRGEGRLIGFDIEYALELLAVPQTDLERRMEIAEYARARAFATEGGDE